MVARRLRLGTLAALCVLAGGLTLGSVFARAAVIHAYLPGVSKVLTEGVPAGSGAGVTGPVSAVGSMTADSGHLWVAELDTAGASSVFRVDEFDAGTGAFVSQLPQEAGFSQLGSAVAVAHGTVYVTANQVPGGESGLAVFGEAGSLLSSWTGAHTLAGSFGPAGEAPSVAVDRSVGGPASGSVYVLDARQRVVDVFNSESVGKEPPVAEPAAGHVSQLTGTCPVEGTACELLEVIPFTRPTKVTVDDSTGDVLVVDNSVVDVFRPQALGGYVFVRQITGTPAGPFGGVYGGIQSVAVDGGNGDIYVGETQSFELNHSTQSVDQFSGAGVFLGRITGANTPDGDLRSVPSVSVDPESHHVFVGDYRGGQLPEQPSVIDVFGPDLVIPDVTTGLATNVTPYSGTLTGTVKLDKEGEATCQFVWGTSREFGQTVPCSKAVTEEESSVQATLSQATGSKLEPDTTYYYRLQATNKNGLNPGDPSQDHEVTTSGPGIHEEAVSNVAATSVTFTARINPHNAPTTAYFQYGTTGGYGTNVPAAPGLLLGSGEGDVEVSPQHVQGLSAGTVYHYRVVAISESSPGVFEEFDGPDQTFTTQTSGGAFGLPDGRSWELVTPPEKKGALFYPIKNSIIQASLNGDAIADLASQPTEAEPLGYPPEGVSVLSTRGSVGWSSQDISPPHDQGTGAIPGSAEYRFFSEDLSFGIVEPDGSFTPLSPEASEATAYLRTDYLNGDVSAHCQSSCFRPLVTAGNTPPGTVFGEHLSNGRCEVSGRVRCGARFIGATPDLSHVVLYVKGLGVVEWADGKLTSTGGVEPGPNARHGISSDGSRIVGHIEEGRGSSNKGLYLRDMSKGETVQLDLPQGGPGPSSKGPVFTPEFMTASSDDSRVFFLDWNHLTVESSKEGPDLYEYDLNAPLGSRLTDLTVDKHASASVKFGQVVGASEDGSYVYFATEAALAPGAVHGNCSQQGSTPPPDETEKCNLYVRHAGVTKLVAALSAYDHKDWTRSGVEPGNATTPVRVSQNGRWLAFMSNRDLTGYDTRDALSGHPDEEVYLYDASSDKLVCASCNPSGARPVGVEAGFGNQLVGLHGGTVEWFAANVPGWTTYNISDALYQSRYLSDSGRLFFNSNDALVPQDVNGTQDVYEYEPVGVPAQNAHECTSESVTFSVRSSGCVGLISSGASSDESAFLDASATGGDVFFLTISKLVSQDFDLALDVYDAHECSTQKPCFAQPPVAPPVCSTGDSCKAAPSPQPALFGSPSSATFSGAGNVAPSGVVPAVRSRSLTRAQKLARALRACRKKSRAQRAACTRNVRKRYGPGRVSRHGNATMKSGR